MTLLLPAFETKSVTERLASIDHNRIDSLNLQDAAGYLGPKHIFKTIVDLPKPNFNTPLIDALLPHPNLLLENLEDTVIDRLVRYLLLPPREAARPKTSGHHLPSQPPVAVEFVLCAVESTKPSILQE